MYCAPRRSPAFIPMTWEGLLAAGCVATWRRARLLSGACWGTEGAMRVLYFSRSYTSHDRRFLVELAASPHEIWYLRLEGEDSTKYELRPVPEGVRELSPLGGGPLAGPEHWIRLAPRLEAVLAEVRPDLVHAGPI